MNKIVNTPLLDVEGLQVSFRGRGSWQGRRTGFRAVDNVSLHLDAGETLGLVGESGSGKSTTGRAVLHLLRPDAGRITFDGVDLTAIRGRLPLELRRHLQVVFQDPYSSLDPTKVVGDLVGEPLTTHLGLRGRARDERAVEALDRVGLSSRHLERYASELSGGQRQRVSIARALATSPRLVVLDEPVSALDVSTQSQVINLLSDLQAELGVSFLFVAHDLTVVRHVSHRIAVMYRGRIVEDGPATRVSDEPAHPYSHALLASVPLADPARQQARRELRRQLAGGEVGGAVDWGSGQVGEGVAGGLVAPVSTGCPFASRCRHVFEPCTTTMPVATPVLGGGIVRCHLYDQDATEPQPVAVPLRNEAHLATVTVDTDGPADTDDTATDSTGGGDPVFPDGSMS